MSSGLYLPFADSPYPQWEFWLVESSTMNQITELDIHEKQLQLQLDNQGTFTGWVDILDDNALAIEEVSTGILAIRDDEPVYSGAIWIADDEGSASGVGQDAGNNQVAITSYGWFQALGGSGSVQGSNGRLVHTGAEFQAMIYNGVYDINGNFTPTSGYTPNYLAWKAQNNGNDYVQLGVDEATSLAYSATTYPNTTDAAIMFDLLDRANIDGPTLINKGQIFGSPVQRNLTLQRLQVVGQQIQQLVNVEAGCDWTIDPITRKMNLYGVGASSTPTIASGYGIDQGQGALFSFPGNCINYKRSRDGTRLQNRVEAVGQYGVGRADDLTSQGLYGILETQDSLSEVTDINILIAYAQAEVAVLAYPWTIITFTPRGILPSDYATPGMPRPFDDYNLGDIVYAYINWGRTQVGTTGSPQAVRVFGFTVNIDDNGVEKVSQVQTTYQGLAQ
jgi:hypothetical protein